MMKSPDLRKFILTNVKIFGLFLIQITNMIDV